ncbi:patatin-like phospholipase family protein [Vibrio sp. FNV 38]|nr:patatin-like phospholipase family protein [Vibrio sp. FNV 38]
MQIKNYTDKATIVLFSLFLVACSSTHTLDVRVSKDNYKDVSLVSEPTHLQEPLRFWGNEQPNFLYSEASNTSPLKVAGDQLNILALSGGGANGAYGAGVIIGMSDAEQLPEYTVITGISAGALIAPFVFAGEDELDNLKTVMLGINDNDVLGKKNFLNTLFKDAFTSGDKMFTFIENAYSQEMIAKVASQHRAGKRLFIGTTHFDSGELVIWNIGEIANSNMPDKVDLIHQVLAASSSIPGVFPPQFIQVEHNGERLEELHVDGGLATQVFFNPSNFDYNKVSDALGLTQKPRVDVIRNGDLAVPYSELEDKGVALLKKSVNSMTVLQARGDIYRIKYLCEINDFDFALTYMESSFQPHKATKDMFDKTYMEAIYHYGYGKATRDLIWTQQIP